MSTQVTVILANGQRIQAINYRMAPYAPPGPSVPASPSPFAGGVYHLETSSGWIDIPVSQIQTIGVTAGAIT